MTPVHTLITKKENTVPYKRRNRLLFFSDVRKCTVISGLELLLPGLPQRKIIIESCTKHILDRFRYSYYLHNCL